MLGNNVAVNIVVGNATMIATKMHMDAETNVVDAGVINKGLYSSTWKRMTQTKSEPVRIRDLSPLWVPSKTQITVIC